MPGCCDWLAKITKDHILGIVPRGRQIALLCRFAGLFCLPYRKREHVRS